jgi:hypothetical protein
VYNSADELADAPSSHRAGDRHLAQNRWGWRERCRIVDHLSLPAFTPTGDHEALRSSFARERI